MEYKKTIICHSFPAWDTPYIKSTVELMTRMSKDYRVIFVDYHYTLKDLFKNPSTPVKQVLGSRSRWRKIALPERDIEVYNFAPILPINWIKSFKLFELAAQLNGKILNWQIKRFVKKNQLKDCILVNAFNPIYGHETLDTWQARKNIYYCYDEMAGTQWSGKHGPKYERKFLKEVDQVIVTSPKLLQTKSRYNNNTKLVPNGVNLDIFKIPEPITEPKQSIGYVGAIDNRIDVKLINNMAKRMPNYQLDFYGPLKVDKTLFKEKNIHFHGSIPQAELPVKIQQMDVCIIPFVKNELTAAIYPLKANEYLAMGKPVVSTNFADLSDFKSVINIGLNHLDFIEKVKKAVEVNPEHMLSERSSFAQNNSWEHRAHVLQELMVA